jgi:hypothetical protein
MKRTGTQRPGQPGAVTWWSRAAGLGVLVSMATRPAMLLVAAAVLALVIVLAAVIAGAAFAPGSEVRQSAARTLDLLLRVVPSYRLPPGDTAGTPGTPKTRTAQPMQNAETESPDVGLLPSAGGER